LDDLILFKTYVIEYIAIASILYIMSPFTFSIIIVLFEYVNAFSTLFSVIDILFASSIYLSLTVTFIVKVFPYSIVESVTTVTPSHMPSVTVYVIT
jgi:hypothetical protein